MASHINILSLFVLFSFLCFTTTEADSVTYFNWSKDVRTTANSSFQFNVRSLLSSFSSKARETQFYNTTITGSDPSDSLYGLFMCRGDFSPQHCQQCIVNAAKQLSSDPDVFLSKEVYSFYDDCLLRYSNTSIFSTVDLHDGFNMTKIRNVSNPESFKLLLSLILNETTNEAAVGPNKYATNEAAVGRSGQGTLYCLAQCTPDLSPKDCRTCLNSAIGIIHQLCDGGKEGGRYVYPSCNIRYEFYQFYTSPVQPPTPAPAIVPATKNDSKSSEEDPIPIYLSHNCSTNKTFNDNSPFKLHLTTLLSYLSSNSTVEKKIFHKDVVNDTVYGLFMCRGDISSQLCGECVLNATNRISLDCEHLQEAIFWYSQCMLRYSYRNFFNQIETEPMFLDLNITNTSNPMSEQIFYSVTLSNKLAELDIAGDSDKKYAVRSSKLNDLQTMYTLYQCTQDLSSDDCKRCLKDMLGTKIPWPYLGSIGGRIMYPSCNLRFELFKFYSDGDKAPPPDSRSNSSSEKRRTIIFIVVPTIISVMLFCFGYYLLKNKVKKSQKTILKENFGQDGATLEPLQFDLVVIEVATNNFSDENCVGEGGFGKVYKGILPDGRQIAVKRLSKSSHQGSNEFKNEVLSIATLQHRNLVIFIGFCLEEQEKILIYEYVPNKSLAYHLFDSQRQKSLSWAERYNIIGGIARGIHYLHEHSRLKVIHRDLKPSNVLLDENMIPKISDFGLSRIVEMNQDHVSTHRVVGTYGYMSPEYAMLGKFSEKSDVFSFGVMILEIITGKKNLGSIESQRVAYVLLSYVWRQWRDQMLLSILDLNIKEFFSENEAIICIKIGLLCVQHNSDARPTMATIVSYLNDPSVEIPTPQKPAFFVQGRMDPKAFSQDPSSTQSAHNSTSASVNEMSISTFVPR